MYFWRNAADNLTFNVKLFNGDLGAVVDKLVEVQKESGNPPAERPRVGARRRRSPAGRYRGSAYEDAGSRRAEDARLQIAQVIIILYYTILYYTILYYAILYYTILYQYILA